MTAATNFLIAAGASVTPGAPWTMTCTGAVSVVTSVDLQYKIDGTIAKSTGGGTVTGTDGAPTWFNGPPPSTYYIKFTLTAGTTWNDFSSGGITSGTWYALNTVRFIGNFQDVNVSGTRTSTVRVDISTAGSDATIVYTVAGNVLTAVH